MAIEMSRIQKVIEGGMITKKERQMLEEIAKRSKFISAHRKSLSASFACWMEGIYTLDGETIQEVYDAYVEWCERNKLEPDSKVMIGRILHQTYGYLSKPATVDGKICRVYFKEDGVGA